MNPLNSKILTPGFADKQDPDMGCAAGAAHMCGAVSWLPSSLKAENWRGVRSWGVGFLVPKPERHATYSPLQQLPGREGGEGEGRAWDGGIVVHHVEGRVGDGAQRAPVDLEEALPTHMFTHR